MGLFERPVTPKERELYEAVATHNVTPARYGQKPVAAIVEYPHELELCESPIPDFKDPNNVELGFKPRNAAPLPPRPDGRPRAV